MNQSLRAGVYQCTLLNTGYFHLDGGSMCGLVPKSLWKKTFPPDNRNLIRLAMWSMLVQAGDHRLLIDTGIGNKLPQKWKDIFCMESGGPDLAGSLASEGIQPEDITDVILTHGHLDHAGGAVDLVSGVPQPAFPNARYHMSRRNFETALNPIPLEAVGYQQQDILPLREWGLLDLHDGNDSIRPGIRVIAGDGHTEGHLSVVISNGGETVLFAGDTVPTAFHCALDHHMGYDMSPRQLTVEKQSLLQQAAAGRWTVVFCHDPDIPVGMIEEEDGDFRCAGPV